MVNGVVNLVLNYVLIKRFGMMGAAYATLISYTMRVVLVYIVTIPLYRIYFETVRFVKIFRRSLPSLLIYLSSLYIDLDNLYVSVAINGIIVFLFPILLYIFGFFNKSELYYIKEFIGKYRKYNFRK